jgi:hypothetical protein
MKNSDNAVVTLKLPRLTIFLLRRKMSSSFKRRENELLSRRSTAGILLTENSRLDSDFRQYLFYG